MTFSFQKKLNLLFSIIVIGIIALGIATYKNNQSVQDTDKWLHHTREVLYESEQVLSLAQDIVLSSRGYVITGDSVFLQPFEKANKIIYKPLNKLENLIKDNPIQRQRTDSLKKLIDDRIKFSILTIQLRQKNGFTEAQQLLASGKGKYFMDEIRNLIDRIQEEENQFLKIRNEANVESSAAFGRSFYVLLGSILLLLIVVFFTIKYNVGIRIKAEEALFRLNKELEQKVHERTAELSKANEELIRQDELLNDSGVLAKVGGWEINLSDMTVRWTNEVFRIHELEPGRMPPVEEAINYYAPEARPVIQEAVANAIATGEGWNLELPFITAKGNHLWVRAIGKAEMKNGKAVRVYGVFQDITVRKLAEQKILKANRLYYLISQINQMIVHVRDEQTLFKKACDIATDLGKLKMAWIGMLDEKTKKVIPVMHAGEEQGYLSEIKNISPDDVMEGNGATGAALREGNYYISNDIENDQRMAPWKAGALNRGYRSSIALPIKKFGKVVGAFSLYSSETNFFDKEEIDWLVEATGDISFALENFEKEEQRKRGEEMLLASEVRYRRLFEAAKDGILILNADTGVIEDVNPFMVEMLGYSHTAFLGKHLWEIGLFKDIVANEDAFQKLKKEHYIRYENLPLKTKEGRAVWVEFVSNVYGVNSKQVIQCNIRDITERKKAELQLEQQNKELLKTNSELDRFVYSTSHDLRAPLKSLLGLAEIINEDIEPDNHIQRERMQMMKQSVIKLDDFIEDILHYSRNTRLEVAKEEINFEEAIQEIRGSHKFMEGTKGLNLKVEIHQEEKFISDKRRVNVILNNLISNAIKYRDASKENSFVKIFVQCSKENAIITVEDNGIGIGGKDKEKIFEMFYRATKQSSGSGLGMYIVKETLEKLGGTITLESELNTGTKFIVTIPNQLV